MMAPSISTSPITIPSSSDPPHPLPAAFWGAPIASTKVVPTTSKPKHGVKSKQLAEMSTWRPVIAQSNKRDSIQLDAPDDDEEEEECGTSTASGSGGRGDSNPQKRKYESVADQAKRKKAESLGSFITSGWPFI